MFLIETIYSVKFCLDRSTEYDVTGIVKSMFPAGAWSCPGSRPRHCLNRTHSDQKYYVKHNILLLKDHSWKRTGENGSPNLRITWMDIPAKICYYMSVHLNEDDYCCRSSVSKDCCRTTNIFLRKPSKLTLDELCIPLSSSGSPRYLRIIPASGGRKTLANSWNTAHILHFWNQNIIIVC